MWPFFSSSYSSARINKVLVEIEMDQQPIPMAQQQQHLITNETLTTTTPAIHLLQSIQGSQSMVLDPLNNGNNNNDDSDSDEEDRLMIKKEPKLQKELNVELLEKLIDQPNLVQEIQLGKNSKLLSYISQDDVLNVLIDYLVESVPIFQKLYFEEQNEVGVPTTNQLTETQDEEQEENGDDDEDEDDEDDKLPYGKETSEERYRRRASTAGEILAIQDPPIILQRFLLSNTDKDAIKSNEVTHFDLLGKLWNGIMESDLKIDNLINITLFVKIIENLIRLNCNEFMNFIRQNQKKGDKDISDQFLKHSNIPQLMELLIKLISMDKLDNPIGLIDILYDQNLITRMIKLLGDENDDKDFSSSSNDIIFLQNSIGDFLTNLISISANTPLLYETDTDNLNTQMDSPIIGPNDLTRSLVSEENIGFIIDLIIRGGHCLPTCVSLIIEIIRKNNSDYDSIDLMNDFEFDKNPPSNRDPIFVGKMLKLFSQNLIRIWNRFFNDDTYHIPLVETTLGWQEPVGFERFKTVELIAELLHCSNMMLLNQVGAELIIAKRDEYMNKKIDLMNDALSDTLIGGVEEEEEDEDESMDRMSVNTKGRSVVGYPISLRDKSNSQDCLSSNGIFNSLSSSSNNGAGTGGVGGGDGSTSLIDLEKLTNDIKSFSIGGDDDDDDDDDEVKISDEVIGSKIEEEEDEELPNDMSIGDFFKTRLIKGEMLPKIFQMLQRYPWNNFLHNVIFDISQQILNGRYDELNLNRELIWELFKIDKCHLTSFICDCYDYSIDKEDEEHLRLGYMGHLILISEEIVKFSNKVYIGYDNIDNLLDSPPQKKTTTTTTLDDVVGGGGGVVSNLKKINDEIHHVISEKEWLAFVNNELSTIRDMYNQVLGGVTPDDKMTYLNPSTILLGNGEEEAVDDDDDDDDDGSLASNQRPGDDDDNEEEEVEMYRTKGEPTTNDDQDQIPNPDDKDEDGIDSRFGLQVIEGKEQVNPEHEQLIKRPNDETVVVEFGESLYPVSKHNSDDEREDDD